MTAAKQDLSNSDMAAAIEASTRASIARWAAGLDAVVHVEPDVTWFVSNLSFALCNVVNGATFSPANVDNRIDLTLQHFKERRVPMCWLVGPSSGPDDLGARLEARGLVRAEDAAGMAIELDSLGLDTGAPAGLTIVEVDDGATLRQWIDILCEGSEFPEDVSVLLHTMTARHGLTTARGLNAHPTIRLYLGLANGKPVATSLLFLADGVAGLYDVATVPRARRRGFGAALSRIALRTARDLGYGTCVLQASAMGEDVYRRLGFRQYCTMSLYFWSPEEHKG